MSHRLTLCRCRLTNGNRPSLLSQFMPSRVASVWIVLGSCRLCTPHFLSRLDENCFFTTLCVKVYIVLALY